MLGIGKTFGALYLATLLMQLGATLLISYLALRLDANGASGFWVGALMAANALGMAVGGSAGRALIGRVGHVRAYAASAAVIAAAVLAHELSAAMPFWLVLRALAGMAMMAQLMVLESWLNERAGGRERGRVLAVYMIATYVGMMLGQLGLAAGEGMHGHALAVVAMAFALCLVPVVMTRIPQPALQRQAGAALGPILRRVPRPLMTVLVSGMINASFFGLGPLYARQQGMSPGEAGIFLAMPIVAGLLAQFPLGLLSDRLPHATLIRGIAMSLALVCVALGMSGGLSAPALLLFAFCIGALQFCLYPLGAAFANQQVEPGLRVALAGVLLTTFGVGSCIGPLIAGAWMGQTDASSLYYFFGACAVVLALAIGKDRSAAAPAAVHETPMLDAQGR
ncbi:MFS transporter [Massilia niastensis]|uniref:MFS transporter n=1 Tax=Massilia niastensis TaxID=544911 RepID=UPI0005932677|nr:MFS transporter [Massilia niastensis]